jgi:rhodanese-related sulfurtransferase
MPGSTSADALPALMTEELVRHARHLLLLQVGMEGQCKLNDINPADDIVVHCKVGGRSAQAYEVLQQAGYTRIKNLKGGILAWADQVDRSMQKY